jgi:choline dehydrogenase-like flavoprotein
VSRTGEGAHLTVVVLQPRSRGTVRLASADPTVSPAIDHGLLAEPADTELLLGGLAVAHRLAERIRSRSSRSFILAGRARSGRWSTATCVCTASRTSTSATRR